MRVRAFLPLFSCLTGFLLGGCADGGGGGGGGGGTITPPTPPADLELELVKNGFETPVLVTAPRGDPRLFVVEKTGRIKIIKNGTVLTTPFLDLSAQVEVGYEQGLLGMAFDPNYAANGRFYVMYVAPNLDERLERYQVSSNPDVASPGGSAILTIADSHPNHQAGMLAFGPDGMLYAAVGDGGEPLDPQHRGQSTNDLFGNILRLDVRTGSLVIPPDNPFQAPARRELWCIGLRNPWRFTFDRELGDLYIADVGHENREEINVAPNARGRGRGLNFGWNVVEGTECFDPASNCVTSGLTPPTVEYDHNEGCCVIGGFVYRGPNIPGLRGTYFYSDNCGQWVRSFYFSNGTVSQARSWPNLNPNEGVTSFGEDGSGELYICTESSGSVYRITTPASARSRSWPLSMGRAP